MISPKVLVPGMMLGLLSSCTDLVRNLREPSEARAAKSESGMGAGAFALAAVRGTTLSALRHPGKTARLGGVVLMQRPRELLAGNLPGFGGAARHAVDAPGSAGFENLLDAEGFPRPVPGKLTWLVDGKRFFAEFERQIAAARESIDVQAYIFDNDEIAVRYADLLKEHSGDVRVRVIFDELGSMIAAGAAPETRPAPGFKPPSNMSRYLREDSAVEVRASLNPWLVCDHTKLHVFDQKVALMGCMNIGREYYSEWHDLMFRVEGPAVGALQDDYNRTWRRANPMGFFGMFSKKPVVREPASVPGAIPLRVMRTDPAAGRYEIRKSMLLAIRAARKRVWIEDPYISHDDITDALEDAARRGVDVRVIFPGKNESKIMDIANRHFANGLVEAGGKAYQYPGMTHLKVMVCDGWASVGSANLDTLSMRINRELNVTFNDSETVNALIRQVFLPDFAVSKDHKRSEDSPMVAPLAEAAADQL